MPHFLPFDPTLMPALDFAAEEFAAARATLSQGGGPGAGDLQAVRTFQRCYDAIKQHLLEVWTTQQTVGSDFHTKFARRRAEERARQVEEAKPWHERKQPKFPPINWGLTVQIDPRPLLSQYATDRLRNFEYVPLYYFTRDAAINDGWENILSSEPSGFERQDSKLSFAELEEARYRFLPAIAEYGWGEEVVKMHADFFQAIASHETRYYQPCDVRDAALMLYFDNIRRWWHETVVNRHVTPLLNRPINSEVLEQCLQQVLEDRRLSARKSVFFYP